MTDLQQAESGKSISASLGWRELKGRDQESVTARAGQALFSVGKPHGGFWSGRPVIEQYLYCHVGTNTSPLQAYFGDLFVGVILDHAEERRGYSDSS